jgi:hypothetical protein
MQEQTGFATREQIFEPKNIEDVFIVPLQWNFLDDDKAFN